MNALYLSWRVSATERDSQRERGREREGGLYSPSHTMALWKDAPPCSLSPLFLLYHCLSNPSLITSVFISSLPTHIHIHMGLNSLTVCCTGPDIHPYIQTVTFRRLKAPAAQHLHQACSRGTRGKSGMAGVTSTRGQEILKSHSSHVQ